mmetsp:Transcript_5713/g.16879  ORF Transcript_5713/g.16879 Transcript_5713/m.16879 type:complete len:259 (+) Transcript_5713:987-1763(+)
MQRCLRTSSMNLRVVAPPEWLSQQQPFTTWLFCSTRRPEPIGGACEKTKSFQPSADGCSSSRFSNQAICSSSMMTSCDVYRASRNTVLPRPTSSVLSAISRTNCGVGLPWIRMNASRFSASVLNSSMPSRSWLPPTRSKGTSKPSRYSLTSVKHSDVPAYSCLDSVQSFDSPRSPSDTMKSGLWLFMCSRPSKVWSRSRGSTCRSPRMPMRYSCLPSGRLSVALSGFDRTRAADGATKAAQPETKKAALSIVAAARRL